MVTKAGPTMRSNPSIDLFCNVRYVKPAEQLAQRARRNDFARQNWSACSVLVIDEISMMSAELFDKLNVVGQRSACVDVTFGGIFRACVDVTFGGIFRSVCEVCTERQSWRWGGSMSYCLVG